VVWLWREGEREEEGREKKGAVAVLMIVEEPRKVGPTAERAGEVEKIGTTEEETEPIPLGYPNSDGFYTDPYVRKKKQREGLMCV
jgi:hypothetical protein